MDQTEEKMSIFKALIKKGILKILGFYLALGWGVIEFTDWLVNHYLLSPHLTDFCLILFLSLLPSVLIVAYFHGKPGRNRWQRFELVAIPINVLMAGLLIFFLFNGRDLGAVSQKIHMQDENGQKIEKSVPKTGFRKKVAVFYFTNQTKDKKLDWWQYGLTYMLDLDLAQDMFFQITTPASQGLETADFYFYNKMQQAGYEDGVNLPLLLMKKIAEEINMDYFLTGEIKKENEKVVLESVLYKSENVKIVARQRFMGGSPFALIDQLTHQLKHDFDLPKTYIDESLDLAIENIFTASIPAARLFTEAVGDMIVSHNFDKVQMKLEQTIKEDPGFAYAYLLLAHTYLMNNQASKLLDTYAEMMKYIYKLPERIQYYARIGYYRAKQDTAKVMAVLKMIIQLYPEDISAYAVMAFLYSSNNQYDQAIDAYEKILKIDPQQFDIYQKLAQQWQNKGDYKKALDYFKRYALNRPKDVNAFISLGDFYLNRGEFALAKENYEKALTIQPDNIDVSVELADIETRLGHFDEAVTQLNQVLQQSHTPQDRVKVHLQLFNIYKTIGQTDNLLAQIDLFLTEYKKFSAPLQVLLVRILLIENYVVAGKKEQAFKMAEELRKDCSPPYNQLIFIALINSYLELKEPAKAEGLLGDLEKIKAILGEGLIQKQIDKTRSRISFLKGDFAGALTRYLDLKRQFPDSLSYLLNISECQYELKQYKSARQTLEEYMKVYPFDPQAHFQMGLIYRQEKMDPEACRHLKIATEIWKNAPDIYEPASLARQAYQKCTK